MPWPAIVLKISRTMTLFLGVVSYTIYSIELEIFELLTVECVYNATTKDGEQEVPYEEPSADLLSWK